MDGVTFFVKVFGLVTQSSSLNKGGRLREKPKERLRL